MVRVAASATNDLVEQFRSFTDAEISATDAEALIALVRETLGRKIVADDQQVITVAKTLVHIKALVLYHAPNLQTAWTEEEWSDCLWESLEPCVSNTLAGQTCPTVFESSDRWLQAVENTLAETTRKVGKRVPSHWSHKAYVVLVSMAFAYLLFMVPSYFEWTARNKTIAAAWAVALLGLASVWFFLGPTHWHAKKEEEIEVLSVGVLIKPKAKPAEHEAASKAMREELEGMRKELDKAKQDGLPPMPPPLFAPPFPKANSSLLLPLDAEQSKELDALRSFVGGKPEVPAKHKLSVSLPKQSWTIGDLVALTRVEELDGLEGQTGSITGSDGTFYEVKLRGGETVSYLEAKNLCKPAPSITPSAEQVYAPFATSAKESIQTQAASLRKELEKLKAGAATDIMWPSKFWAFAAEVANLHPALQALLQLHGFLGAKTIAAPRTEELSRALRSFEVTGHPRAGASASLFEKVLEEAAPLELNEDTAAAIDMAKWHRSCLRS